MTSEDPESLRQRTRRAVRDEITRAALTLFLEHGYDATTTIDIAVAAGMSPRSLFRYFATKEDIVIGKLDLGTRPLLNALSTRPQGESLWTSMREAVKLTYPAPASSQDTALLRMVFETPALMSVYLQRLQTLQEDAAAILSERAHDTGNAYSPEDPTPRVIANAAFGCLVAAQKTAITTAGSDDLPALLDRALTALTDTLSA